MAREFLQIARHVSRVMKETATAIGVYSNPTGKGDGREDLVRQLLRERVGTTFGVAKAEVVDACGKSSSELDAVVFDQSVASSLHVMGQRQIVRVEAVALNIEVKSTLSRDAVDQTIASVERLDLLRRYYQPSELAKALQPAHPDLPTSTSPCFRDGLRPTDILSCGDPQALLVPQIVNGIFAFGGQNAEAAKGYLANTTLLDFICVLGEYVVGREAAFYDTGEGTTNLVEKAGEDMMAALLTILERGLQRFRDSRAWVTPAFRRYYAQGEA